MLEYDTNYLFIFLLIFFMKYQYSLNPDAQMRPWEVGNPSPSYDLATPDHESGLVTSGYRVKILGPHPTRHTVGSGFFRVGLFYRFRRNFLAAPDLPYGRVGFFGGVMIRYCVSCPHPSAATVPRWLRSAALPRRRRARQRITRPCAVRRTQQLLTRHAPCARWTGPLFPAQS